MRHILGAAELRQVRFQVKRYVCGPDKEISRSARKTLL